jgi:SAM-dependent methyltransferase
MSAISFDRAAEYYDQTRALPDALMEELVRILLSELPAGRCLEIGIGTGRIALPLMRRGVEIYGVDISIAMLRKLVAKAGDMQPNVAIADATRLPFRDGTFASAIASHVLHLIPDWRAAVDELLRVVRRGGVVVASRGGRGGGEGWARAVRRRFFDAARSDHHAVGADRIEQVDAYMSTHGAAVRTLTLPVVESTASIAEVIAGLEAGYFSACWPIDEDTRRAAAAATREWAATEYGELEVSRPTRHAAAWHAYVLP